jgi:SAM-dependent methyltransferase
MRIVDAGCGNAKFQSTDSFDEVIGIDIEPHPKTHADIACFLGFEEIPIEDSSVDIIIANHFFEHLPDAVHYQPHKIHLTKGIGVSMVEPMKWQVHRPLIYLFNEMWRILKHEGVIIARLPLWPSPQAISDPTHQSYWTDDRINYFCGDYFGFRHYGHTSRFAKRKVEHTRPWELKFELVAVKDRSDDDPFLLEYEGIDLWKTILV